MWQRELRRWIWRGSAALSLCAVALVIHAATFMPPDPSVTGRVPALVLPESWRIQPSLTVEEQGDLMTFLGVLHGIERAVPPTIKGHSVASEPPLAAYEVMLYIRDPGGTHGVSLSCKDPAHPRTYHLLGREPHDGVVLNRSLFGPRFATFEVSRGDERFTFRVPLRLGGDSRAIRSVGSSSTGTSRPRAGATRAPLAMTTAKYVPFHDDLGNAAGVRITGVKPGSWLAEIGLEPGDVVTTWDGNPVSNPQDFLREAEAAVLPRAVGVTRGVATRSATSMTLRHS